MGGKGGRWPRGGKEVDRGLGGQVGGRAEMEKWMLKGWRGQGRRRLGLEVGGGMEECFLRRSGAPWRGGRRDAMGADKEWTGRGVRGKWRGGSRDGK